MKNPGAYGSRTTADQVIAGIDLSRKHIVVTGCGSGIGFQTACALAANGAHVIATALTLDAARQACRHIGNHSSPVECDLANLESVTAAAAAICQLEVPLDAIIATAGIAWIGHFLLINDLTNLLRDDAGRVVIVSNGGAAAHAASRGIMFENLSGQQFNDPKLLYEQSQLANALYSIELSRRLRARGISVNTADPGLVRGMAISGQSFAARMFQSATWPWRRSPAQGAATVVLLAASPQAAGVSGEYWRHCKIAPQNALLANTELASRLWNISENIVAKPRAARTCGIARAA